MMRAKPPDGREVEAVLHRHVVERRGGALSHGGELAALEAGKSGPIAEVAQLLAQQVLHAFGPRIVLAVDDVQDPRRGNRDGGAGGTTATGAVTGNGDMGSAMRSLGWGLTDGRKTLRLMDSLSQGRWAERTMFSGPRDRAMAPFAAIVPTGMGRRE